MNHDVYLFGQILATRSILLRDGFLKPDEYSEISQQFFLPGGETGTAATVLASLGASVIMDGTWIGTEVAPVLQSFYKDKPVDLSLLTYMQDDPGVTDTVVIAGLVRSPMGRFQTLFSSGKRWWGVPQKEHIAGCRAAGVDPYFGEESLRAAEICTELGIPYVTIDCAHDSLLHRNAAVNAVSHEFTDQHYPGMSPEEIFSLMQAESSGLTIITQGGDDMLYGRRGEPMKRMKPFNVKVKSTLGAGDTFKAGCIYGVMQGLPDDELVRFASACSGIAISRFPLPLNPPTLGEVRELIASQWG
ncbi:MAG: carbohydrate kinase family protein [Ruminococcus sp.]|nr:carbohydrate kinase family protein [Ruminococcus sp.]